VEPTGAPTEHDSAVQAQARLKARRRKVRRRLEFWFLFLLVVALGVGAAAVLFGWSPGSSSDDGARTGGTLPGVTTTTSGLPPLASPKPYKTTDGVNVRAGPGTNFASLGTVQTGVEVLVICAIDGESVIAPPGATNQWLRIDFNGKPGWVTAAYVAIGPAVSDPNVTARCPSPSV
jgi:uncharacterized protein YgiM (DUF1202 family)